MIPRGFAAPFAGQLQLGQAQANLSSCPNPSLPSFCSAFIDYPIDNSTCPFFSNRIVLELDQIMTRTPSPKASSSTIPVSVCEFQVAILTPILSVISSSRCRESVVQLGCTAAFARLVESSCLFIEPVLTPVIHRSTQTELARPTFNHVAHYAPTYRCHVRKVPKRPMI